MLLWRREQRISKTTLLFDSAILSTIITCSTLILCIIISGIQFSCSEELAVQFFSYNGSSNTHNTTKKPLVVTRTHTKRRGNKYIQKNNHKKNNGTIIKTGTTTKKIAPTKYITKKIHTKKNTPFKKISHPHKKNNTLQAKKETYKKIKTKKKENQINKKHLTKNKKTKTKKTKPIVENKKEINIPTESTESYDTERPSTIEKITTTQTAMPKEKNRTVPEPTNTNMPIVESTPEQKNSEQSHTTNNTLCDNSIIENTVEGGDEEQPEDELIIETSSQNNTYYDEQTALVCAEVAETWHPPAVSIPQSKKVRIKVFFDTAGHVQDIQFIEKTGIIAYDYAARGALLKAFNGQYPVIMASRNCIFTF